MKLILLISILSLSIGAPYFTGDNSQDYPDARSEDPGQDESQEGTEEFNFQYTKLTTGVYTGWKIMGKSLLLAIKSNNQPIITFSHFDGQQKRLSHDFPSSTTNQLLI